MALRIFELSRNFVYGTFTVVQNLVNTVVIKVSGYSVTGSNTTSMIDLSGTWNTSGSPSAILLNITNTASNANAKLLDLQVGSVTKFSVGVGGNGIFSAGLSASSLAVAQGGTISWTNRGILSSEAAGSIQFGAADSATPVNQELHTQGSRAGTDANVGGANLTVASGHGTGTGTVSSIEFKTPLAPVASGTGAQTQATGLAVKAGCAKLTSYLTASLPTNADPGSLAFATDSTQGMTAGIGLVVAGGGANGVPVFFDGTSWRIG